MKDLLNITLPKGASADDVQALESALKSIQDVQTTGRVTPRGVDPGEVMMWIKVGSGLLSLASTAVPVVKRVVDAIRGKGLKGVKLELPGGAKLEIDSASVEEIDKLVKKVGAKKTAK